MSVAGVRRVATLNDLAAMAASPSRRTVEVSDIRYAEAKRGLGWGWQAIAGQLKVNQTDLMRACGEFREAAAAVGEPRLVGPRLTPGSKIGLLLAACTIDGACADELMKRSGLSLAATRNGLSRLRAMGLVEVGGFKPTDAGLLELEKLSQTQTPREFAVRQLRVLMAVAAGTVGAMEIAHALGIDATRVYSAVAALKRKGLLSGDAQRTVLVVTEAGRAALEALGDG